MQLAHVMRQENCGVANCQSIPLKFAEVAGGDVPQHRADGHEQEPRVARRSRAGLHPVANLAGLAST